MGVQVTLKDIQSGFLTASAFNSNNTAIESAFDKTLDRTSNTNNQMHVDLDMGTNKIFNLKDAVSGQEAINYSQLQRILAAGTGGYITVGKEITHTATTGQTLVSFSDITYKPGTNNLSVYVNGVRQTVGDDYLETSSSSITFISSLQAGDLVNAYTNDATTSIVSDAQNVSYTHNSITESVASFLSSLDTTLRSDLSSNSSGKGASLVSLANGTVENAITYVTPQMFGAVGDGVADDTIPLQNAIDFISSSSTIRKLVATTGNTFRITNTLKITANNVWIDLNRAGLTLDDSTGLLSHIIVGDGTTQKNQIIIDNIVFGRTQAATAGYAIDTNLVGIFYIRNCRIYGNNKIYNGVRLHRSVISYILYNFIDGVINYGLHLEGSGLGSDKTIDTTIIGNRIENCKTCLYTWDFVEGLFCRNNIFYNTSETVAVMSASTNANGLVSFKLQQNDFDTSLGAGIFIENISNVQITDNWFGTISSNAIQVNYGSSYFVITNNQIYSTGESVQINGDSCLVESNIMSGGTTCIFVGASATNTVVSNNTLSNANKAIDLSSNPADADVVGNKIYSMSSGAIYDATTPNSRNIRNNIGDTQIGTVSYISVGASPFTYTSSGRPENISIFGGTVSDIKINGQNVGFTTDRSFIMPPNTSISVTYSSSPYITRTFI